MPLLRLCPGAPTKSRTCGRNTRSLRRAQPHFAMRKVDRRRRRSIRCFATCSRQKGLPNDRTRHPCCARSREPAGAQETAPGALAAACTAAAGPRAEKPLPGPSDWTFELIEQYHDEIRARRAALWARHLSEPARDHHRRADDGRLRLGRHAGELPPLVATARSSSPPRRATGAARWAWPTRSSSTPNPCIAYLMEENTMTMQALVIAHAAYGHNSLLQGQLPVPPVDGRVRRSSTTSSTRKNYIAECEERHGLDAVEDLLDSCHALHELRRRPLPAGRASCRSRRSRRARDEREAYAQSQVNDLWRTLPRKRRRATERGRERSASRPSRRRTCCTSSRRTRRCWSRGSARSCASCARSRSTSIRSARRR